MAQTAKNKPPEKPDWISDGKTIEGAASWCKLSLPGHWISGEVIDRVEQDSGDPKSRRISLINYRGNVPLPEDRETPVLLGMGAGDLQNKWLQVRTGDVLCIERTEATKDTGGPQEMILYHVVRK